MDKTTTMALCLLSNLILLRVVSHRMNECRESRPAAALQSAQVCIPTARSIEACACVDCGWNLQPYST